MAIIKCKMCGGDIELSPDKTFGTCDSCGSTMTLPKIDNEQRAAAFNRGNHFRRIGEFDKALAVYERIVQEDETDAEAHWCCALCRFGIEYVEDPETYEWLPTCHRMSFDSFLEDVDYLAALDHSDGITRRQYQREAARIADVQRAILATSQNEEPFDVFICYKETDEQGNRTRDSMMAQDIYYSLTEEGRRVFFARITLEDKAGAQYEPYIFAALNSAKVMVVVGTSADNFNAVWVKNEWSRFLSLMRRDRSRLLLPCYRDMDPYDLPEQLSILQSYDMSKIGFLQDLVRGIDKVLDADKEPVETHETVVLQSEGTANPSALLRRGELAIGDGDWQAADEFFDRALDMNAEWAEAYYGKFLARVKHKDLEQYTLAQIRQAEEGEKSESRQMTQIYEDHIAEAIKKYAIADYLYAESIQGQYARPKPYLSVLGYWQKAAGKNQQLLQDDRDLQKARRFSAGEFKESLEKEIQDAGSRWEELVHQAEQRDQRAEAEARKACMQVLEEGDRRVETLYNQADARREEKYQNLCKIQASAKSSAHFRTLANNFEALKDYKDSAEHVQQCQEAEKRYAEKERKWDIRRKWIFSAAVVIIIAAILINFKFILPAKQYREAEALLTAGDRAAAAEIFAALGNYQDAATRAGDLYYSMAQAAEADGNKYQAVIYYERAAGHDDAQKRSSALWDEIAVRDTISAGRNYTVGLKADGTVVAIGENYSDQCEVKEWRNIVAVSAGGSHTVGLKADGTVVATGSNAYVQYAVDNWTNIVAIAAGKTHTVGLRTNGTVVATGSALSGQCNIGDWHNIIAIGAGDDYTVGLRADGTVVTAGSKTSGRYSAYNWSDIIAISAGDQHIVGLKSDGTVVAAGANVSGECNVNDWTDIVAISAGHARTVGLKSDGTVVAVGSNYYLGKEDDDGPCDVDGWTDIVAISTGYDHTVGLKSDGTVVAVGDDYYGQRRVDGWTDILVRH